MKRHFCFGALFIPMKSHFIMRTHAHFLYSYAKEDVAKQTYTKIHTAIHTSMYHVLKVENKYKENRRKSNEKCWCWFQILMQCFAIVPKYHLNIKFWADFQFVNDCFRMFSLQNTERTIKFRLGGINKVHRMLMKAATTLYKERCLMFKSIVRTHRTGCKIINEINIRWKSIKFFLSRKMRWNRRNENRYLVLVLATIRYQATYWLCFTYLWFELFFAWIDYRLLHTD